MRQATGPAAWRCSPQPAGLGADPGFILIGALSLERFGVRVPKFLVALGASSYSLYLVHPFILPAFGKAWSMMHLSAKLPAFAPGLMAFSAALLVAHGIYLWLKKPMTAWLLNAFPKRAAEAEAA